MTVSADRTIDNELDVARRIPTSALAEKVLTAREGVIVESLTGPGVAGTVELSHPAWPGTVPALMLVHDNLGAFAPGGAAPAPVAIPITPTHFTFTPENPNGKAELAEAGGRDYSAHTMVVAYSPYQPEAVRGGQSSIVPTDL